MLYLYPGIFNAKSHIGTASFLSKAQNNESREHCICIRENQDNLSQNFLRNSSNLMSPLAHVMLNVLAIKPWDSPLTYVGLNMAFYLHGIPPNWLKI